MLCLIASRLLGHDHPFWILAVAHKINQILRSLVLRDSLTVLRDSLVLHIFFKFTHRHSAFQTFVGVGSGVTSLFRVLCLTWKYTDHTYFVLHHMWGRWSLRLVKNGCYPSSQRMWALLLSQTKTSTSLASTSFPARLLLRSKTGFCRLTIPKFWWLIWRTCTRRQSLTSGQRHRSLRQRWQQCSAVGSAILRDLPHMFKRCYLHFYLISVS